MSRFTITRTQMAMPDEKQLEGARALLFGTLDGFGEDGKKAWRRLWKRLVNLEPGELCEVQTVVPRNPRFHRKFFALLNIGFDAWEPAMAHQGITVEKNFDQFREEVIILAGHYVQTWTLAGEMRLRAKSISFSSMDDEEFEKVYNSVANVLLSKILTTYADRAELDAVVDRMLGML
jgi:hypothetical protein